MSQGKISIVIKGSKPEVAEKPPGQAVLGERYVLQEELGRGGVGEVLLGYDLQLERPVAVKRVYLLMGASAERARFAITEAKRLARLQHPNIVTVYDVLDHQGDVLMVMEYLNGYTIEALQSPLTLGDFINFARQSLSGLEAAHSTGMIHLDIKPTNLMLSWLGTGQLQVKLLDFGLAMMLEQPTLADAGGDGTVFGSVYTMAPEQLERNPVDARTDLYSLGCVFYYALTRRDPFQGESVEAIIDAHLRHNFHPLAPQRPDLPPALCAWVERLMSRDPQDRPASASAALRELLKSPDVSARNTRPAQLPPAPDTTTVEIHLPDRKQLTASLGQDVVVHGIVTRVWENMPGNARFINFTGVDHLEFCVVVILKDSHPEFGREQMDALVGRRIRVTGRISEFHDSPQLIVHEPAQIQAGAA